MSLTALIVAASICIAGTAQDKDLAPLYCPARAKAKTTGADGSKLSADDLPDGFGKTRLRIAERYLARRDESLEAAAAIVDELTTLMGEVETTDDPMALKKKLTHIANKGLDEAEQALLRAVELEGKRLLLMRKAAEAAFKDKRRLEGLDRKHIEHMLARHESGDPRRAAEQYIAGLRMVAEGLVDYIDKDMVAAVAKMERATKECPDLAVAFLYLGSFSYIIDQPDSAIAAWRRVLELDPGNKDVRAALKALGIKRIGKPTHNDKKKTRRKRK